VAHGIVLVLVRRMVIGGEAKRLAGRWIVLIRISHFENKL
jgi:hypothetical protein